MGIGRGRPTKENNIMANTGGLSTKEILRDRRRRLEKEATRQIHHIEPTFENMTRRERILNKGAQSDQVKAVEEAQRKIALMNEQEKRMAMGRLRTSNPRGGSY